MHTARASWSLALLLLIIPAVDAGLLDPFTQHAQQRSTTASAQSLPDDVTLHRLGDLDGDGRAEVLAVSQGDDGVRLRALGGPGLDAEAWSATAQGWFYGVGPDLDGDGLRDPLSLLGDGGGTFIGQGLLFAFAGTWSFEGGIDLEVRSATDGGVLATYDNGYTYEGTGADVFPLLAYASAEKATESFRDTFPVGVDQAVQVEGRFEGASVYAGSFVGTWRSVGVESVTVRNLDGAGGVRSEVALDDPLRDLVGLGLAVLDGDDLLDVVAFETVSPTGDIPGPAKDVITAWSGADGSVLWSLESEVGLDTAERYVESFGLGDVDGDGAGDLSTIEWWFDETTFEEHSLWAIRSGRDGSVLDGGEGAAVGALPWGDADGDGSNEYLWVSFEDYGERTTLGVRSLGETLWERTFTGWVEPMEPDWTPWDLLEPMWSDLTGDGAPDLLLRSYDEDEELVLVDGADGSERFRRSLRGVHDAGLVADLTGDGLDDLVVVRVVDEDGDPASYEDSNATATVEVLRGSDGARAWRRAFVQEDGGAMRGLYALGHGVGDVDGDGAEDVYVEARAGRDDCCFHEDCFDCVSEPVQVGAEPEVGNRTWRYVLSGRDGGVLWGSDGETVGRPSTDVLPPVEPGAAFQSIEADVESPVPAGLALLALAVALVRRR